MQRKSRSICDINFAIACTVAAMACTGCNDPHGQDFLGKYPPVILSVPKNDDCNVVQEFDGIRLCSRFIDKQTRQWGDKGWTAQASYGNNISLWCFDVLRYKTVNPAPWRRCIQLTLEGKASNDDFTMLVPPTLGEPKLWVGETGDLLGLYFVNSEGTGVVTLVSKHGRVAMQCIVTGAVSSDHEPIFYSALTGVFLE